MVSLGACSKAATPKSQVTTKTSTTATSTASKTTATTSTTTPTSSSDIFSLAQDIPAVKYTIVSTSGPGVVEDVLVYLKKDEMRFEMDMGGISTILLVDPTSGDLITYTPAQNTAYKTSSMLSVFEVATMLGGFLASANPQANGTETIDGIACQIYEYSDSDSGSTSKTWLWKDKGLPIKIVMTDSSGTNTIEYKNYDFSDIPDSMFVLPAGVTMVQAPGS